MRSLLELSIASRVANVNLNKDWIPWDDIFQSSEDT